MLRSPVAFGNALGEDMTDRTGVHSRASRPFRHWLPADCRIDFEGGECGIAQIPIHHTGNRPAQNIERAGDWKGPRPARRKRAPPASRSRKRVGEAGGRRRHPLCAVDFGQPLTGKFAEEAGRGIDLPRGAPVPPRLQRSPWLPGRSSESEEASIFFSTATTARLSEHGLRSFSGAPFHRVKLRRNRRPICQSTRFVDIPSRAFGAPWSGCTHHAAVGRARETSAALR